MFASARFSREGEAQPVLPESRRLSDQLDRPRIGGAPPLAIAKTEKIRVCLLRLSTGIQERRTESVRHKVHRGQPRRNAGNVPGPTRRCCW